jgi:hypothetical protein
MFECVKIDNMQFFLTKVFNFSVRIFWIGIGGQGVKLPVSEKKWLAPITGIIVKLGKVSFILF